MFNEKHRAQTCNLELSIRVKWIANHSLASHSVAGAATTEGRRTKDEFSSSVSYFIVNVSSLNYFPLRLDKLDRSVDKGLRGREARPGRVGNRTSQGGGRHLIAFPQCMAGWLAVSVYGVERRTRGKLPETSGMQNRIELNGSYRMV